MTQTRVRVKPEVPEAAEAERGVAEAGAEHIHGLRQNELRNYAVSLLYQWCRKKIFPFDMDFHKRIAFGDLKTM